MKRLQHKFSCEYYTCFEELLRMGPSENDKKRFLGKATGHNDHYMTDMGGQWSKIGCN